MKRILSIVTLSAVLYVMHTGHDALTGINYGHSASMQAAMDALKIGERK